MRLIFEQVLKENIEKNIYKKTVFNYNSINFKQNIDCFSFITFIYFLLYFILNFLLRKNEKKNT